MKIKAYSKSELARIYQVNYDTLKKWIDLIPNLGLRPDQRILTPKQVEMIIEHVGKPD
jgi:hypothetical protein